MGLHNLDFSFYSFTHLSSIVVLNQQKAVDGILSRKKSLCFRDPDEKALIISVDMKFQLTALQADFFDTMYTQIVE